MVKRITMMLVSIGTRTLFPNSKVFYKISFYELYKCY
jgi:hypothetical protein